MLHYTRQASPYRDGLFPTTSAVAPAAAAGSGRYRASTSRHRPSPHHARSTPSPYGRVPHPYNVPAGSAVDRPGERLPTHSPTTPEHSLCRQKGSPLVSPSDMPHRVVASAHAHRHSHSCHSDSRCLVGGACRETEQEDDREEGRRRCYAQPDTQGRRKGKDSPPHEHRRRRHSSSRHTKRKTSAHRCPCDCEGRRQTTAPHTDIVDHFPAAPSAKDTSRMRGLFGRLEREAAHALDAMPDASTASSSSAPAECACAGHTGGPRPSSRPTRTSQAATANTLELYRTLLLQAMAESAAWEDRTHALEAAVAAHQERERKMARQLQRARQALTVLAAYAEGAGCAAAATRAPQPEREGRMATAFNAPSSSPSLSSPSPSPQRHATVDQMCRHAVESGTGVSAAAATRLSPAPRRLFSHSAVSELIHGSLGRSLELACRSPAACSSEAEAEGEEESAAGSEEAAALPAKARYGPRWRSIGDDEARLVTPPSLFSQSRAGEAPAQAAPAMAYWHQASGRGAVERQGELTLSGARERREWMVQTHQPPAAAQADTVREALPAVTSAPEAHASLSQSRHGASPPQRLGRRTYADPTGVLGVPRHPRHTPAEEKRQRPPSAGPVSGHNRQIQTARARDSDEMASGASPFIEAELDSSQNTSEHVDSDHSAGQPPPPPPAAAAAAAVKEELAEQRGQLAHPPLEMHTTADSPLPPPQPFAVSTTALAAKDLLQLMRPRDTSPSLLRHTPHMAQSTSVATAASTSTAGSQLPPRPPLLPSSSSAAATATTTPRSRSADYEVTVLSGGGRAGAGAAGTEPASAAHRHRGEAVGSSSAASSVRRAAGGAVHNSASTEDEQQQEEEKEAEGKKGGGKGFVFHPAPFPTGPPGGGVAPPLSSSLSAHGSCVSHPEPLPSSVEETEEEWESVESGCESATTSSRYSEEEV